MRLIKLFIFTSYLSFSSYLFASTQPTLVLVHGALLTSTIWGPVQNYLQNHHYNVVTLDVPGRMDDGIPAKNANLDLAARKVCDVVKMQHGPVILVGHSQGGAIITQAVDECATKIKGLVYIAAVVPLNGEKPYDLLSEIDGKHFDQCTHQDLKNGLYQINYNGPIKEMFMDDVNQENTLRAIANMVPEPIVIGENSLHFSNKVFASIPKFYIETSEDKIISPATQKKYLDRTSFVRTYTLKTSHSPFLSQPKQLGKILSNIADSFLKTNPQTSQSATEPDAKE